jgi:hypothetical protein
MSGSTETPDDDPKDDLRLMTSIDGEPARLLVHIEPIEDADDVPTSSDEPPQASPPSAEGLAE